LDLANYYQGMEWQPGIHLQVGSGLELVFFHGDLLYQGCLALLGLSLLDGEEGGLCPCLGLQLLLLLLPPRLLPQQQAQQQVEVPHQAVNCLVVQRLHWVSTQENGLKVGELMGLCGPQKL
jgi:hypothetical protein